MDEDEGEEEKQKATRENEAESSEPAADEPGTSTGSGRFYDCIFCKRGFTTAQALGGHMNIHRKDRARLQPTGPSSSSPKRGDKAYHPYSRPQHGPVSKQTEDQSYVVYFPVSSGESTVTELQLGLGRSGPKEEEEGKKKEVVVDEDLDLELRLGQRKSHDSSSSDL